MGELNFCCQKNYRTPHSKGNLQAERHKHTHTCTHAHCLSPSLTEHSRVLKGQLDWPSGSRLVLTSSLPNTFVFSKGYLNSAQLSVATCVEKQGHEVETSPEKNSVTLFGYFILKGSDTHNKRHCLISGKWVVYYHTRSNINIIFSAIVVMIMTAGATMFGGRLSHCFDNMSHQHI